MSKKKILPVCVSLPCCLLLVFTLSPLVSAETLYGIIGSGTNAGYLVTINTSNGAATLVGDTGIIQPTGLAYSAKSGILYATGPARTEAYSSLPSHSAVLRTLLKERHQAPPH